MSLLSRIMEAIVGRPKRDSAVVDQDKETTKLIRTNTRLLRELGAIQGVLERPRPSSHHSGDAPWGSKGSSSH